MEYYKSFNVEALELSKSLPEEQSELYKRYFIPLPLEQFEKSLASDGDGSSEEAMLREISETMFKNLKIRFDIIFGGRAHLINSDNKFVKVVKMSELTKESFLGKLYKSKDDKLVAFIHAHTKKIIFVEVPKGVKGNVNILFVNSETSLTTQIFVNTENESELSLFEWYASATTSNSFAGALHEVKVGAYGKAEISMIHNENASTYVVGFTKGMISDNAKLKVNYIYNGGINTRVRNEIRAVGHAAKSEVIELVMGSDVQKFDLNTIVANVGKDTISDLESKAVLMDSSICFLKGFASVGEEASGSRSFVNERGILLDKKAYMSSIPGMSINNSNVKATHSSATAPVEENFLFYLMSRGTSETTAKKLLVSGFFSSSIAKMESSLARESVASLMNEKINNRKFGVTPKLDISSIWFDQKAVAAQGMFAGHYKYREGE